MNSKDFSFFCAASGVLFLILLLSVPVAWSAPGGKKHPLKDSTEKSLVDPAAGKEDKNGKKLVKKKAVKKAGTAAAVTVAGKKMTSAIKPDKKKSD